MVAIVLHFALFAGPGGNARRGAQLLGYVDVQYAALREQLSEDETAQLTADGAAWSEDQAAEAAQNV
jgi:hypothetical protein